MAIIVAYRGAVFFVKTQGRENVKRQQIILDIYLLWCIYIAELIYKFDARILVSVFAGIDGHMK